MNRSLGIGFALSLLGVVIAAPAGNSNAFYSRLDSSAARRDATSASGHWPGIDHQQ